MLTLPFATSSDRARQCRTATFSQKHHGETNRDTIKADKVTGTGFLRHTTNCQRDKWPQRGNKHKHTDMAGEYKFKTENSIVKQVNKLPVNLLKAPDSSSVVLL